jgi:hypothetical protein
MAGTRERRRAEVFMMQWDQGYDHGQKSDVKLVVENLPGQRREGILPRYIFLYSMPRCITLTHFALFACITQLKTIGR